MLFLQGQPAPGVRLIVSATKSTEDPMVGAKSLHASLAEATKALVSATSPLPRTIRLRKFVRGTDTSN